MLTINEILDLIQNGKINESNLESKDLMKIQFYTEKLNEEVYKNYITAYHRTKDINEFLDKSNEHGFKLGGGEGAMYGVGLYGNYTWKAVHTPYSIRTYGDYVVKYIVRPNNILFFDEDTQVKIYGKPMTLIEQCDYWDIKLDSKIEEIIKSIQKHIDSDVSRNNYYTSDHALNFYNWIISKFKKNITSQIFGISYNGRNDNDTILMYDFRNVSIVGWYDETKRVSNQKDMIPLSKTHNYYNPINVSKRVISNTDLFNNLPHQKIISPEYIFNKTQNRVIDKNTQFDNIETFISLSDEQLLKRFAKDFNRLKKSKTFNIDIENFFILSQNVKEIIFKFMLYKKNRNELSKKEVKIFPKIFAETYIGDDSTYKIDKNNQISYINNWELVLREMNFNMIPTKLGECKTDIRIDNCNFYSLLNMFDVIYQNLYIFNCSKLTTLEGIENLKFKQEIQNGVYLRNLNSLVSLKYLPKDISELSLQNIPNLVFDIDLSNDFSLTKIDIEDCDSMELDTIVLNPRIKIFKYVSKKNINIDSINLFLQNNKKNRNTTFILNGKVYYPNNNIIFSV